MRLVSSSFFTPRTVRGIILRAAILIVANGSWAQTFTPIDFPGATLTIAYGINKSGQIVGTYTDTSGTTHGFLLSDNSFQTIDYPGGTLSVASGINDSGIIVGQFNDTTGRGHGFAYFNNQYKRLPDFGNVFDTAPVSVSDNQVGVGFTNDQAGLHWNGFEFVQRKYLTLDYPGANFTVATGISSNGAHIVGTYNLSYPTGMSLGFMDNGGNFTNLEFPGSTGTQAFGVNDASHVVGNYFLSGSQHSHGFIESSGKFTNIDFPGATQTTPYNLDDLDNVVGAYVDSTGITHGYRMTP